MSSALKRPTLVFDDREERSGKRGKRPARAGFNAGQEFKQPYKRKGKKLVKVESKSPEQLAEENVKKLLALSKPTANTNITEKIVRRAIKGRPLLERIEVKVEEEKSILFPDEPSGKFEKEYCS